MSRHGGGPWEQEGGVAKKQCNKMAKYDKNSKKGGRLSCS